MQVSVRRMMVLISSASMAVAIAGCGGGDANVKSVTTTTPTGRQLIDLRKALDTGAISQDQYEKERARILKGN